MSSSVALVCLLATAVISADAVVAIKADEAEVVVGADAKQMMRNVNHPTSKTSAEHSSAPAKKTVTINLYYETRCPDCIEFVNGTLAKMWKNKDLRPFLNITMNPYGNAMSIPIKDISEGYKFWHPDQTGKGWDYVHICQHGSDECLGNLIQACAISQVEQEKYMELIFCMAQRPDWSIEKASYECMDSAGIDRQKVKECATTPHGNKLFADLGKLTQAVPGRQGTPWVMINGQNLANVGDLMRNVCGDLGDHGPSSCTPFSKPSAKPPPAAKEADDGDFTVLPALKKATLEQDFVKMTPKREHI